MTVMMLSNILLIGVFPPVEAFTLLLPYPPKAGRAMKHPPMTLAIPKATSSRFALNVMPWRPSPLPPPPRLFAATDDSKKPSKAIKNDVPMASRACFMDDGMRGKRKGNGLPVLEWTFPSMSTPLPAQSNLQAKTADRTTTTNRSGT